MDFMANKALLIAVGVFITLAITSGVLMVINNIQQIYGQVYNTDTSITSQFSEVDKFSGGEFTGLDIANALRKYEDDKYKNIVTFQNNGGGTVTSISEDNYSTIYTTELEQKDGKYTIIITIKK